MPEVIFHGGAMAAAERADYLPDGALTVLELARRRQLPLHWRCGLGTCGTCAVRVTVLDGCLRPMAGKERNVLAREGYPVSLEEGAANWRLICGYVLSGESLRVEW